MKGNMAAGNLMGRCRKEEREQEGSKTEHGLGSSLCFPDKQYCFIFEYSYLSILFYYVPDDGIPTWEDLICCSSCVFYCMSDRISYTWDIKGHILLSKNSCKRYIAMDLNYIMDLNYVVL